MKKTLDLILLIDDDEPTNFLHEMILKDANCAKEIKSITSAEAALEYLRTKEKGRYPKPDLIFLDINMPGMDGWTFLDHYEQLPEKQRAKVVVVMLTTSLNPDDAEKAEEMQTIHSFKNKPLSEEVLNELFSAHFKG